MSQKLKNSYQAKSTVQMWQKYFKNKKSRNLLIFFRKHESIVIEYSLIIFIFRTKSLSLNSQCHLQAEPHLSISDFLSTYLVHLERKVHAPRPDQILWSSLEVGKSRRFSRYLSLPWLQLKLIEVAVRGWNSTKCILTMAKVWVEVVTIYWQKIDNMPSLRAMFSILLHLPYRYSYFVNSNSFFFHQRQRFLQKNLWNCAKNICCINLTIYTLFIYLFIL
jgi:hypothetical protein